MRRYTTQTHVHCAYTHQRKASFWDTLFSFRDSMWLWLELKPCWLWWETPECWTQILPGLGMCHMASSGLGFFWSSSGLVTSLLLICRFIQYCKDEGGYTGFTQAEDDEDVAMRLASLYISIEATGDRDMFVLILLLKLPFWSWH